jgi:hypothetical protein
MSYHPEAVPRCAVCGEASGRPPGEPCDECFAWIHGHYMAILSPGGVGPLEPPPAEGVSSPG